MRLRVTCPTARARPPVKRCAAAGGMDRLERFFGREPLAALRAAESLTAFWLPNSGPERCHELKGDLAETFSIDLKQPYRLLFDPVEENPTHDRSNERERWGSITAIKVVGIEDTHG